MRGTGWRDRFAFTTTKGGQVRLPIVMTFVVAMFAANQGSLIEVVNRYGSFFYGSLLGVFILAILTKRATARGAFWGLLSGMAVVLAVALQLPWIAFLWHNLIGAVVVVVVGMGISYTQSPHDRPAGRTGSALHPDR